MPRKNQKMEYLKNRKERLEAFRQTKMAVLNKCHTMAVRLNKPLKLTFLDPNNIKWEYEYRPEWRNNRQAQVEAQTDEGTFYFRYNEVRIDWIAFNYGIFRGF